MDIWNRNLTEEEASVANTKQANLNQIDENKQQLAERKIGYC